MTTETFVIQIRQDGAQATAAAIDKIGVSAKKGADTMAFFRKALVAFSIIRVAENVVNFADAATRMTNRLKVATKSTEDFARAMEFIKKVSRESRTDIEANATIYSRLLRSTEGLKFSTNDLEKAMEGMTYAIKVGGATSQEARNSLIQFSQSLASGALRGDELRSVAEQLPALANAIGKEFGMSGGKLLAFAKANPGILQTEKVVRGVIKAAEGLKIEASKMVPTMSEGFLAISSAFIAMLYDFNAATGTFTLVSKALRLIAEHINIATIAVIALTAAWAISHFGLIAWSAELVAAGAKMVRTIALTYALAGAQGTLNIAIMANPYVAAAVAIAAFVAALVYLYNTVPAVKGFIDGLWVSLKAMAASVYSYVAPALPVLSAAFDVVSSTIGAVMEVIGSMIGVWIELGKVIYNFLQQIGVTGAAFEVFKIALQGTAIIMTGMFLGAINLVAVACAILSGVLNGLGLVSDEQNAKVQAATEKLQLYSGAVLASVIGIPGAAEQLAALNTKFAEQDTKAVAAEQGIRQFNDGMDAMGQVTQEPVSLLGRLGGALDTVAPAAARTADSLNKTSEATVTIEKVTPAAMEQLKKMNPELFAGKENGEAAAEGYGAATGGMKAMETQARKTIKALQDLAAAQSKVSGGAGMNSVDGKAAGGPVSKGTTYLVGEKGPELFTANTSGVITPNHQLLSSSPAMNMGAAANDNSAGKIVAAMSMLASTVSDSNVKLISAIKKNTYTMSQYSGKGYTGITTAEERAAVTGGSRTTNGFTDYGADYTRPDGRKPLPGDADYVANNQSWGGIIGNPTGMGGAVVYGSQDLNDPANEMRTTAQLYAAWGNQEAAANMNAMADKLIEQLKNIRDNTANLKQFKAEQAALMGTNRYDGTGDLQTLLPILGLGGKIAPESDPYGVGKWKAEPPAATGHGELASEKKDSSKSTNIQIVLQGVKDFGSFRNNQAQLDSAVQSAVKRANRRAA